MKFLLAITFIAISGLAKGCLAEDFKDRWGKAAETCMTQEGVSLEDLKQYESIDETTADKKIKCFTKCLLDGVGITKDGVIDEDECIKQLGDQIHKDKIKEAINKCQIKAGGDQCDAYFKSFMCVKKSYN